MPATPASGAGKSSAPPPDSTDDIVGDPVGRDALLADLAYNMIPYTPEELIALARKELAWCEQEMIQASRELKFGDNWHRRSSSSRTSTSIRASSRNWCAG